MNERRKKLRKEYLQKDNEYNNENGFKTTAEIRPTAYLTDDNGVGDLGLPKPYGKHAPFKPSETGIHLKRIRQPAIRSIEI